MQKVFTRLLEHKTQNNKIREMKNENEIIFKR